MKQIILIYLAGFLFALNLVAQPPGDQNWDTTSFFYDHFNPPRSPWSIDHWMDIPYDKKWKAHLSGCVTHGENERQVYQKENAIFNAADHTMRLKAEYAEGLIGISDYTIPLNITKKTADSILYYKSGAICIAESEKNKILYGYFEARCRLPVNRGAFPAFWLWDSSDGNYREIDIFEYSWNITTHYRNTSGYATSRYFEGQIYYYNGPKPANEDDYTYGRYGHNIPLNEYDLTNWHTYGMEWSPKRVLWYFDNQQVGSFVGDSIPAMSMNLDLNNAVDSYATPDGIPLTEGFPNEMCIDYVKVSKLKCACSSDTSIQNERQLIDFDFSVYKTITLGGFGYTIALPFNTNTVLRATDGITINGDFSVPLGSSLDLITHSCPQ
ncbi:MAG TPA: family 16 glycosylhydrolase [Prolixibacteraceae bacterium]|nr:family 16 glycosylhydrolase [Prolixibacteraceae bacterium]